MVSIDWWGLLMALLAIVVPLSLAWVLLARGVTRGESRRADRPDAQRRRG